MNGEFTTFLTGVGVVALIVNAVLLLGVLIVLAILLRFVLMIKREAQAATSMWSNFITTNKTRLMVAGVVGKVLSTMGIFGSKKKTKTST